jgi:hypothetical protein
MKVAMAMLAGLLICGGIVVAGELKSGLEPGKDIDAFDVVKCAGAIDDGVDVGAQLCYRCKYGSRPMVMVFARTANDELVALTKQLDKAVAKHEKEKLAAFVNLLGEDRDSLEAKAKELGEGNEIKMVPIVVPVEFENGPEVYGINPEADVTVILASNGKVVANHALAEGELNEESVKKIIDDLPKTLK